MQALFSAVDAVNPQLPRGNKLSKSPDTALVGSSSPLDSLGLVNLIVATEQNVEEEFNVQITLADDAIQPAEDNPFRSLGTLADHIHSLLERRLDE